MSTRIIDKMDDEEKKKRESVFFSFLFAAAVFSVSPSTAWRNTDATRDTRQAKEGIRRDRTGASE